MASLQDDSVGVATALSPVGAGHFKFYHTTFIVRLGLNKAAAPDPSFVEPQFPVVFLLAWIVTGGRKSRCRHEQELLVIFDLKLLPRF